MAIDASSLLGRLSPRKRQFLNLGGICLLIFGVLWAVFAITDTPKQPGQRSATQGQHRVTDVGIMAPGAQVDPREKWIGDAGKDVAQLKQDRDQARAEKSNQERFNQEILNKFELLKQDLAKGGPTSAPVVPPAPPPPPTAFPPPSALAPGSNLPPPPAGRPSGTDSALPAGLAAGSATPQSSLVRVTLSDGAKTAASAASSSTTGANGASASDSEAKGRNINNYLPVSFTQAVLLGGLDAPTGGQAQNNPQPVLLRLVDNAVLPNRFRGQVRECFVVGAGYGDISSERGYIRTENLSCVRKNGGTLEVKLQGSIFGEDGKVGMRGRLVTKQGQMLANALIAGIVGGIGVGFQNQYTNTTSSTFGTFSSTDPSHAFEAGIGAGVGRAMDRLANYYISLAEKTFPVIEIDAGRMVDVVITKGVVIDEPFDTNAKGGPTNFAPASAARMRKVNDDED